MSEQEQEISNWTRYWLRKSAERFSEFLLPATAKPDLDLADPPWTLDVPNSGVAVIAFVMQNPSDARVTDILPLVNNRCQHGAWLASWHLPHPADPQGYTGRAIWQPDALHLMVDIEHRALLLRQFWKNPRYFTTLILGTWLEDDVAWRLMIDTIQRQGIFRVWVPADMQTFQKLHSVQGQITRLDHRMELALLHWPVHKVVIRGTPTNIVAETPYDGFGSHTLH